MIGLDPTALYSRSELVALTSETTMRAATAEGLRAVAGRYLGKSVLDALARAHDTAYSSQSASREEGPKGGSPPDATKTLQIPKTMEKNAHGPGDAHDAPPVQRGPNRLRGQIARILG